MKYNVGDKVRVRKDLKLGEKSGIFYFDSEMEKYEGCVFEVFEKNEKFEYYVLGNGSYALSSGEYVWTDEMLEPVSERESVEKPEHYKDKNGKDLFQKWYEENDMQTFRAIMRAIAERYTSRYERKNGLKDLEKGIYVLSRLKEYEEGAME